MKRLLICDGTPPALQPCAGSARGWARVVVCETTDPSTWSRGARGLAPDAVLLGESLARRDRWRAVAELRRQDPVARAVVVVLDGADAARPGRRPEGCAVFRGAPHWQLEHAVTGGNERCSGWVTRCGRGSAPPARSSSAGSSPPSLPADLVALYFGARDKDASSLSGLAGAEPDRLSPRRPPWIAPHGRGAARSSGWTRLPCSARPGRSDPRPRSLSTTAAGRSAFCWSPACRRARARARPPAEREAAVAAGVLAEYLRLPPALSTPTAIRSPASSTDEPSRPSFPGGGGRGEFGGPVSLIVISADRARPLSRLGLRGQRRLRLAAQRLGRCLRVGDQLFRIDDRHFGVIVSGEAEEAQAIFVRLRRRRPRDSPAHRAPGPASPCSRARASAEELVARAGRATEPASRLTAAARRARGA